MTPINELRAAILAKDTRPSEKVEVPAWGTTVTVRGLSGRDRDAFEATCRKRVGKKFEPDVDNVRAKLLVQCLYDAAGQRIFQDDDAEELGGQAASVLEPLVRAAQRLSGLEDEDVKELAENLAGAPAAASPSV